MNSWLWIYIWFHYHEFTSMNSKMNSYILHMNSNIWFHVILHDHEFISKFILWIHIRFHDHEFICYISWPMNSYMNNEFMYMKNIVKSYLESYVPRFQIWLGLSFPEVGCGSSGRLGYVHLCYITNNAAYIKTEVHHSFITTTVWEQCPRSHHKGATSRVWTGNQLYPVLCYCQLGQDIPDMYNM